MAFVKKATTILLCLFTSALAELTGASDDVAAVEVDEAANMKVQLLQKASVKEHTQEKENSAESTAETAEKDLIKVQYTARSWQQLVDNSTVDYSSPELERKAALLAELQEIDAKLAGNRTEGEAGAESEEVRATWYYNKCNSMDWHRWNVLGAKHYMGLDMDICSNRCWGNDNCVSGCMKQRRGYSAPCSHCFGSLSWCASTRCASQCSVHSPGHYTGACDSCIHSQCHQHLFDCMGSHMNMHGMHTHWMYGYP